MSAAVTKATENASGDVPLDLIEAKHAARIAQVHVSGVHRWVQKGHLRGFQRVGRLFVSRGELMALFQPVPTAAEQRKERKEASPPTKRERSREEAWVDRTLREFGVRK